MDDQWDDIEAPIAGEIEYARRQEIRRRIREQVTDLNKAWYASNSKARVEFLTAVTLVHAKKSASETD
jgi:hypothetical protein